MNQLRHPVNPDSGNHWDTIRTFSSSLPFSQHVDKFRQSNDFLSHVGLLLRLIDSLMYHRTAKDALLYLRKATLMSPLG